MSRYRSVGRYAPPQERFQQSIYFDTTERGCWLWVAARSHGYGRFWDGGRLVSAHRYAWEKERGAIPSGMYICHHCDNPACVRPDHLFLGDQLANMQDAAAKGRNRITSQPGEMHPNARLTEKQVLAIRERWGLGGASQRALAREYGTSQATIHGIVTGRSWRHLQSKVEEGQ